MTDLKRGYLTCFLSICLAMPQAGWCLTNYAVLIGVSEYELDANYSALAGPRNDAQLLYTFLQQRGFDKANISLLAEDLPQAIRPTRKNILAALDKVVSQLEPDDFVYFHFSGHGSQQPTDDASETDGLDEIILPADTGTWSEQHKSVENVITDDVIAGYIDRIRAKRAFVWMVFDSCHSGTMTRGNVVTRKIPRSALGIPAPKRARHRGAVASTTGKKPPPVVVGSESIKEGGYIGFFAAQTNEETPEMPQATDVGNDSIYGLFTFNLVKVLATYPSINYQQAAEQILKNYASHPWYGTTPHFAGTDMSARIFGARSKGNIKQWKLNRSEDGLVVNAGRLHQIGEGAILAVVANPAAETDDILGYVTATDVGDLESRVNPVALEGDRFAVATKRLAKVIDEDSIPSSAYARLVATSYSIELSVGVVDASNREKSESTVADDNKQDPKVRAKGDRAMAQLRSEGVYPISLRWASGNQPSDIKMLNTGKDIYLVSDYEELPCPYGACTDANNLRSYIKVPLEGSSDMVLRELRRKLRVIAKALNLMRLSNTMETTDLVVSMSVKGLGGETTEVSSAERPVLYQDDEISLLITNETEEPQDLTVLFVDSSYGIQAVYPSENQFNRFMPYDGKEIYVGRINLETTGPESLIIISNSVFRASPATDFRFLAQERLARTRGLAEPSKINDLLAHFQRAGQEPTGKEPADAPWIDVETSRKGSIQIFQWVTGVRQ